MLIESEYTEHGAATIVSAISSYYGVSFGVSLRTKATLRKGDGEGTTVEVSGPEKVDDRLVLECVRYARGAGLLDGHVHVSVESQIPPSRGMKSSSSVSLAVLGAAMQSSGRKFTDGTLLRMSAEASIRAGVSVTGAYDDAAACHYGGIVFTSNRSMRIMKRLQIRGGYKTVFCIPRRRISKPSLPIAELSKHSAEMKAMYDAARKGMLSEACMSNTMLLCSLLDIDPSPAAEAARAGAVMSGLTGTGPAFFAVAGGDDVNEIVSVMGRYGSTIVAEPRGVSRNGHAF